jgi:xylulokinase
MSLLAFDIGSSTCKAVVFAATTREILARHSFSYSPESARPSFAEMNPEKFWDAVCCCSRAVTKELKDPVRALGLSSHGESFVPVDAQGTPLTNAILNQDTRAIEESTWCEEAVGREALFRLTGLFAHPMYPIPKILWLRKHEPRIFAASKCFLTVIGYLLQKMGLRPFVDYSLASRFLAFDILKHSWSDEILQATGLRRDCLPVPVAPGTIAGTLNTQAASHLGLSAGTPVVMGGHDQPCSALGSGVIDSGRVSDSLGTYECLLAASHAPNLNAKALASSLNSYCHVVPDKFVTLAYFPSGIMVQWFHDLLFAKGPGETDHNIDHYADLEAHVPDGPTGLCVTPHLIGTCNPEFDPRARGLIAGLSAGTDRAHIYKGILEGLACELSIVAEVLAEAVGKFEDIYVTGGGTRSALGLQLRAALTGCRLHVMSRQEAACLGTAILAGVAVGEYASLPEAVATLVNESAVVAPSPALSASYGDQLNRYKELRSVAVTRARGNF